MKIVFLDEYSLAGRDLTPIRSAGEYTGYDFTRPEEVVERCSDADVVITNKVILDATTLRQLPRLRLICVAATGTNNIDLKAAEELHIAVRNVAGYSTHAVAETTLGAALSLRRQCNYYDRYVKSGDYAHSERLFHHARPIGQLYGAHWGIVGLGTIGHEVARLATAFGCEVRYYATSGVARQEHYPACSLEALLAWADIVSIHCPLNDHTRNLIGATELKLMRHTALLINVARGGIVDEAALAQALNEERIAGAALDVFAQEPMADTNPLLQLRDPDRLLVSPHNAWATAEAIDILIDNIGENIRTLQAHGAGEDAGGKE